MNNKGIVLGLLALVGVALISIILMLSVNTFMVQSASQELRAKADIICNELSFERTFNAPILVNKFVNYIDNFTSESIQNNFKLKKAVLTLPVYTDMGISQSSYNINSKVEIKIKIPKSDEYNLGENWYFPKGLFKENEDTGNTYGCYLEGEVKQYSVSGDTKVKIVANSITNNPLTGKFDVGNKGLLIAISPFMESDDSGMYDPILPSDSNITGFLKNIIPNLHPSHPNYNSYAEIASIKDRDIEQLKNSCLNPPTLIRNIFASVALRVAAGTGVLRRNTSLVLLNRVVSNKLINDRKQIALNLANPYSPLVNDRLIRFGEDLLSNIDLSHNEDSNGLNNPFNIFNIPINLATKVYQYQDYVNYGNDSSHVPEFYKSNSLKHCLHLFRGNELLNISKLTDPENKRFTTKDSFNNSYFTNPSLSGSLISYDADKSWSDLTNDSTQVGDRKEDLPTVPAYQIPFLIGSSSNCPSNVAKCIINISTQMELAKNMLSNSYRPDMVGLFRRLTGVETADPYVAGYEKASVLIITHTPINDDEATEINKYLFSDQYKSKWKNRRVVVIYIPTSYDISADEKGDLEKNMKRFNSGWIKALGLDVKDTGNSIRPRMFMFTPELEEYDYFSSSYKTGPIFLYDKIYSEYWQNLILGSNEDNIANRAEKIIMTSFFLPDRLL